MVSTRKGLFVLARASGEWRIRAPAFLGDNVTRTLADGGWYAALNLGHFGVKLRHSTDEGQTGEDRAVPVYPEGEEVKFGDGKPPRPASLIQIWSLEPGGS